MNGGKAPAVELMLQPMGALMKSAYAEALEEWVKIFRASRSR